MIALYEELGSYRAVASIVGCDHKTVKRYVELAGEQGQLAPGRHRARLTDPHLELIRSRVDKTKAKITARRLQRELRAAPPPSEPSSSSAPRPRPTCAPAPRPAPPAFRSGLRRRSPLAASRGAESARAALERAERFGRYGHGDLEAICDSLGATPPEHSPPTPPLELRGLPEIAVRPISAYAAEEMS